ncbi:MAG: hypothetical protein MSC31_19615, partial [Solirubrobacteraceae bacterium MAG38_C4-C5]|nr:hypothetical protein [Candidatus Siliceabacter maunaloa]
MAITTVDPPPDTRSVTPETEAQGPINPNAGTEYGCTPDPSGEPTYCGENPPDDPDNIGALGGGLFGAQSASTDVSYGIADNNPLILDSEYMLFDSPAFQALEVRRVRRTIPWNIVLHKDERYGDGLYDDHVAWVQRALKDRYIPLLSIERCRGDFPRAGAPQAPSCVGIPPTREEYRLAIQGILQDPVLGQVKEFTAWNEPNNSYFQPTDENPDEDDRKVSIQDATFDNSDAVKAGTYWYDFWTLCQDEPVGYNCTVAAGDFLDSEMGDVADDSTLGYRYYRKYVKGMNNNLPERWAWHAYSDSEFTLAYPDPSDWWRKFRSFARRTSFVGDDERSPFIWLTEQGAVRQDGDGETRIGDGDLDTVGQRAKLVTNRMTRASDSGLFSTSSRILRFYYYQMRGDFSGTKSFDSGLLTGTHSGGRVVIGRMFAVCR